MSQFFNCSAIQDNDISIENTNCSWAESDALNNFQRVYSQAHGYVSTTVCALGIISNVLMIIVLTTKKMISPTNLLLTALAASDMTTMASYLVYTVYMNIIKEAPYPCVKGGHSFLWIVFVLFHNAASITSHVAATMITIALAAFRYIVVYFPTIGPQWCSLSRAKYTVFVIFLVSTIVTLPNNAIYYIKENPPYNKEYYWFYRFEWVEKSPLSELNMYIYGAGIKVLASLFITILSGLLLIKMRKVKRRHMELKNKSVDHTVTEHNRTTTMLVVVVSSFVLTELPQGVLNLAAASNTCIMGNFYMKIGDLMDTLVLLNSGLNFVLLCGMSSQFRQTFWRILLKPFCHFKRISKKQSTSVRNPSRRNTTEQADYTLIANVDNTNCHTLLLIRSNHLEAEVLKISNHSLAYLNDVDNNVIVEEDRCDEIVTTALIA